MEMFIFNDNPLDFERIFKNKENLGKTQLKKINKYLQNLAESDINNSNNIIISIIKERINDDDAKLRPSNLTNASEDENTSSSVDIENEQRDFTFFK